MFTRLTRAMRLRAAATLALAYALCVLAPPVALAFMASDAAMHCLTMRHAHRAAAVQVDSATLHAHHGAGHDHAGGAMQHQAMHGHDGHHGAGQPPGADGEHKSTTGNCCGFFCLSAMPASPVPDLVPTAHILAVMAVADTSIAGRGPSRIDRPPIVRLPS